jgi:hypothetical protein
VEFAARLASRIDDTDTLRRASGFDVIAPALLARGRLVARRLQPGKDRAACWRASFGAPDAALLERGSKTAPQSRLDARAARQRARAFAATSELAGHHAVRWSTT